MLKKVFQKLQSHPFAQVKFPSAANMREFADMVCAREPMVDNIIGFMDLSLQNVAMNVLSKTRCIADMTVTRW